MAYQIPVAWSGDTVTIIQQGTKQTLEDVPVVITPVAIEAQIDRTGATFEFNIVWCEPLDWKPQMGDRIKWDGLQKTRQAVLGYVVRYTLPAPFAQTRFRDEVGV